MTRTRIIEPRVRTHGSASNLDTAAARLPDTLVSDQVQRLAICTAVGFGLWTYGLTMDTVVRPLTVAPVIPRLNLVVEALSIALSAAMFLYVRYAPHMPAAKTDAGLVYFVLNAVGVSLLNNWGFQPGTEAGGRLSWTTVAILVWAMIMPTTPRKMLAATLAAASMDPLAVWLGHLRG